MPQPVRLLLALALAAATDLAVVPELPAQSEDRADSSQPAAPESRKPDPSETEPAAAENAYSIPDGTPEQILKSVVRVARAPAYSVEQLQRKCQAIVEGTGKILAADPNDDVAVEAIEWRFSALDALAGYDDAAATRRLKELVDELKDDRRQRVAAVARRYDLQLRAPAVVDKEAIDPMLGARYRNVLYGVIYNKASIKAAEAPKTLEDVVKPQYRGKLVMPHPSDHTLTTQWLASLDKIMPKARAEKFIRDLAAAKPIFVESIVPAADRVGTGTPWSTLASRSRRLASHSAQVLP